MNFMKDRFTSSNYNTDTGYYSKNLRLYMLKVYNYMTIALGITGVVAYVISSSDAMLNVIYNSPLQWVLMFAPIAFVWVFHAKIYSMSSDAANMAFWAFAVLMGASLSWIFVVYVGASVARVFFIASSMFAAAALYGNTTKKDLGEWSAFLIMGVVGLIVASVVNIFMQSSALQFAVSLIGVVVFVGLTAHDTQKIKDAYYRLAGDDTGMMSKAAIIGAITLYFDFINIFISLLHLMGERK